MISSPTAAVSIEKDKGSTLLLHQVRKLFRKVVADVSIIEKSEAEGKKQISSLVNLLDQRQSVLTTWPDGLRPLATHFPDLQAKLMVKISTEVDNKVDILRASIQPLKQQHTLVSHARTELATLLKKQCIDPIVLHEGSPTVPPLQIMLNWVNNLELELRELYFMRLHYLDHILDQDVPCDNLITLWNQSSSLFNILHDIKEQTVFFLEDAG